MAKVVSNYVCQQCGYEQLRWFGRCPSCNKWNTAVESIVSEKSKIKSEKSSISKGEIKLVSLSSIATKSTLRISTKIPELDRVLGGGLVSGQVILIAGEPGIGKSTLLLQVADKLTSHTKSLTARSEKKSISSFSQVLYVSGEESVTQVKIRADRLGIENSNLKLLEGTDIDLIIETANNLSSNDRKLEAVIIDSIQTMTTDDLSGMAGSVGQVRECAYRLVRLAKEKNVPVFIVGHVTKEGTVAGPSVLMHIVDTVLWFEGDKSLTFRLLRAVKNRFGPTDEVGVFYMEDKGLISVVDPEKIFIGSQKGNFAGNITSCIIQGTRPILIEVQSLIVSTKMAFPKRISQGFDLKRLELILAVLTKRCGIPFYEQDVFVNLAGGITVKNDPSIDLAIALSCASSFFDRPLPSRLLALGELGLLGDVREVIAQEKRIREAKRLGYNNVISSNNIKYLQDAIRKYFRLK